MIDTEQQRKFERVWDRGDYRGGSTAQRLVDLYLPLINENETINDYGCGTGRAEIEILKRRPNQKINMVDIAKNAIENKEVLFKNSNVNFFLADLCNLEEIPHADWGLCINVLMTVQPQKLGVILRQIANTCNNMFFEAYDLPDHRLGMDMTTVKLSKDEWQRILSGEWKNVEFIESPQSKRRYIFVCEK